MMRMTKQNRKQVSDRTEEIVRTTPRADPTHQKVVQSLQLLEQMRGKSPMVLLKMTNLL